MNFSEIIYFVASNVVINYGHYRFSPAFTTFYPNPQQITNPKDLSVHQKFKPLQN